MPLVDLEVPEVLQKINRVARLFTVGCSTPKQSVWHERLVGCLFAFCLVTAIYILEQTRRTGTVGVIFELAVGSGFILMVLPFRHVRTHLTFDNVLIRMRARTIALLKEGHRPDLVDRVDELLRKGVVRRFKIMPVVFATVFHPALFVACRELPLWERIAICLCASFLHHNTMMDASGWFAATHFHQLQIQLFHDTLAIAFDDLAKSTTRGKEARASGRSTGLLEAVTGEKDASLSRSTSAEILRAETEFFDERWVMTMTVAFVDIGKSMGLTSAHSGAAAARLAALTTGVLGLLGLSMLFTAVTVDAILSSMLLLYFAIQNLAVPLVANNELKKVRKLAFECYGE
jgi:hypothetical protein